MEYRIENLLETIQNSAKNQVNKNSSLSTEHRL